jgi:hypothetical protein
LKSVVLMLAAAVAVSNCVRVEGFNNPTIAPGWHLYASGEVGYAVALPKGWAAFDLDAQSDLAVRTCSVGGTVRDARKQQIDSLHQRQVRLFVCDSGRDSDSQVPIAYAAPRSTPPSEGLDRYLDGGKQADGREVVERRHVNTNAGDMVVRHIRERITLPDGTTRDTLQYQYFVVRFSSLHILLIEFPTALTESYAKDVELIGTSFTPVR